jgi:hypothetical protein
MTNRLRPVLAQSNNYPAPFSLGKFSLLSIYSRIYFYQSIPYSLRYLL